MQVKTGNHLYFRYPGNVTKVKSVARKKLGLDVRADGGYVIARPPFIKVGIGGHVCNWKIKS